MTTTTTPSGAQALTDLAQEVVDAYVDRFGIRVLGGRALLGPIDPEIEQLRALLLATPAPTLPDAPRWIAVSERMPELWQEVLIASSEGVEFARFSHNEDAADSFMIDDIHDMQEERHSVTHWMNLPEAPKEPA